MYYRYIVATFILYSIYISIKSYTQRMFIANIYSSSNVELNQVDALNWKNWQANILLLQVFVLRNTPWRIVLAINDNNNLTMREVTLLSCCQTIGHIVLLNTSDTLIGQRATTESFNRQPIKVGSFRLSIVSFKISGKRFVKNRSQSDCVR